MHPLRPSYQVPIYNEIPRQLKQHRHIIVQSPAGSGKSVIIAHTAQRIMNAGKTCLILTHRTKIHGQLLGHTNGHAINPGTPDNITLKQAHTYVAMQQTLAGRPNILAQLSALGEDLVIIADECHIGIFCSVYDQLPQAYRIGFSATPAYKHAKFLPEYYKALIHGPQIKTLIAEGSLVPFDYYEMQVDLSRLKKDKSGEYTDKSQDDIFGQSQLYAGLEAALYEFEFSYTKGLIFCSSIKACDALYDQLQATGFQCGKYHTAMKDGELHLAAFTHGNTKLLVSVGKLSEGFDYPPLDLVVLYRATTSLPLFIQMGMRCSRPHPGKRQATILDFGGNNTRHQDMVMDRDWNGLWQKPVEVKRDPKGIAAVKNCPGCEALIPALARSCSYCGYIFPESDIQLREGILVQVQQQWSALMGRRLSELTATELALYAQRRDRKPYCTRIAKAQEQTQPGFLRAFAKALGYKVAWAYRLEQEARGGKKIDYHDALVTE